MLAAAGLLALSAKGWTRETPAPAKEAVPVDVAAWLGADNYPPEAIRAGEQGRVVAIVAVDATGRATACRIDVSIGSPALEKGTCAAVLAKGRFEPARDAAGRAVASELTLPVRWALPESDDDRQPSGPFDMTQIVTVGADDVIAGCEMVVDGKPQATTAMQCSGPGANPAELRPRLKMAGGYRMRLDVVIRNGDTPPPSPLSPGSGEGRLLTLHEARQSVDAEGVPSACTVAVVAGEWADEARKHVDKTPCEAGGRFFPVRGADGAPKPAQVLVAVRVTLLPPAN